MIELYLNFDYTDENRELSTHFHIALSRQGLLYTFSAMSSVGVRYGVVLDASQSRAYACEQTTLNSCVLSHWFSQLPIALLHNYSPFLCDIDQNTLPLLFYHESALSYGSKRISFVRAISDSS